MNKTININLGGFFFHIDEVAYQVLKRYLEAIAKSLSDDPQGKNEIIQDIEARISELLSENIKDERQVVNEEDINAVIKIMGQPEDYGDGDESYTETTYQRTSATSRKLFRDGEDKFLGGVASGFAHYFSIDTIWMRLAFILLTITIGFGIPIYILLWILLPEARTTAEKLQMEGEPVTIDNIERKIKKEIDNVSEKIKNADYSKAKSGFQDFLDTLGKIIISVFKIVGKFIGAILMFVAAIVLLSLLLSGFSLGSIELIGISDDFIDIPAFFYDSIIPTWLITILGFIAVGFPFLILFVLGLRIVSSKVKQFSRPTSLTLLGIWIIAILGLIFTGIEYSSTNAFNGSKVAKQTFQFVENDTLRIKVVNDEELNYKSYFRRDSEHEVVYVNDEKRLYSTNVQIDILESENDSAFIKIRRESEGKNRNSATEKAEQIEYDYQVIDNNIILNGYFLSDINSRHKDEKVSVTLYLPIGMTVYFTNSVQSFIYDIKNTQRILDRDMINHYFTMTENGFECTDCDERLYRN
ncbi:PspC domain-containing protein [Flavicella sediminum]|uniref:PspC domain-containing protein n=1 Tax=Flavicella sediminum TaxID=2585141 RepID=UPI001123AD9F|nr:PspC domain-containing protein [Flavicella sediminum]